MDCADAKTIELVYRFGVVSPRSTLSPNTRTQSVPLLMSFPLVKYRVFQIQTQIVEIERLPFRFV